MSLMPVHHYLLPAIGQAQIAETTVCVMVWYEAVHFYKKGRFILFLFVTGCV